MLADLRYRLRSIFRRQAMERELDEELRFHFEREVEKRVRSGLPLAEARRQARLAFGAADAAKEECRQARGVWALESLAQDVRCAFRGMRRSPMFALIAVLTIGFGVAGASTVLTLANALLFRELPLEDSDEIVVVQPTRRDGTRQGWVGYLDYAHFRDRNATLKGLAAHYSTAPLFVTVKGHAKELNGAVVSGNFFPLLGVQPALGRFFLPEEDAVPNRDRVAVLSHELWRTWFAASPDALGATLAINGVVFTVVGVAPAAFRGLTSWPVEIYMPTMMASAGYRWCTDAMAANCTIFDMIGRLADGRSLEQARAEMQTLIPPAWARAPEGENTGVDVAYARGALHTSITRSAPVRLMRLLAGVAALLLLVCCVNLAGLLIARNAARAREFAIRVSVGAGRVRLIRQLLTESLVLAVLGGAAGVGISLVLSAALEKKFFSMDGQGHPQFYDFTPNAAVILAVIGVSVAAGFLLGFVPAFRSASVNAAGSLERSSSTPEASRLGRWLAGAQAAAAVALVAVAGLLATGSKTVVDGINTDASKVALMRLRPRLIERTPDEAHEYVRTVVERLEAMPGVESVSMVGTGVVLLGGGTRASLPGWDPAQTVDAGYIEIGPRYFEALGTAVLRGREFDRRDGVGSLPVAVINETFALRFWPDEPPVGATVVLNGVPRQVVGVVQDVPLQSRDKPPIPYAYVPYWQNPEQVDARLCIRVAGDPSAMLPALVREANRVDPDVPIAETITLQQQLAGGLREARMTGAFVFYAALLAVLLSAVGLYGSLAFAVSRRTREIGIRIAVGAERREVLAMVMREGMGAVGAGVGAGVGLAALAARFVRHLLYGAGEADVLGYAGAALLVLGAGALSAYLPARRAAAIAPLAALREP